MRVCSNCKKGMVEKTGKTPEGVVYRYYKCNSCGEEVLDMKQLHDVAEKYRDMRKYRVKLSNWGLSLGLRIPKELVERNKLHKAKEVEIIEEKVGFKVVPVKG